MRALPCFRGDERDQLTTRRLVFVVAGPEIDPASLELSGIPPKKERLDELAATHGQVKKAITKVLEDRLGVVEKKVVKPKEVEGVALSRSNIRYALLKDGTVLIKSEEGVQGYLLDEERGLRPKPGAQDLSAEISQEEFVEYKPQAGAVQPHLAQLRARQFYESIGKWETPQPKIVHASSFLKLNPRLLMGSEGPEHDLVFESPKMGAPKEILKITKGKYLTSWSINSKSGLQGVFLELSLELSDEPETPQGQGEIQTVALFSDLLGNIIAQEPSETSPFPRYPILDGIEIIGTGNAIIVKKGSDIDVLHLPVIDGNPHLGKLRDTMTIGDTEYLSFGGTSGKNNVGQFAVAINRNTGKIDKSKGKGGLIAGEAVFFDKEHQNIMVLADAKAVKKTLKKMTTYDVSDQKAEKKFQPLDPKDAREVMGAVSRYSAEIGDEFTYADLGIKREAIRKMISAITPFTGDERVFELDTSLRAAVDALGKTEGTARREETTRRKQEAKLSALEEKFEQDVEELMKDTEFDPNYKNGVTEGKTIRFRRITGQAMDILRPYKILRDSLEAELNEESTISQLDHDRITQTHEKIAAMDERLFKIREAVGGQMGLELERQKINGLGYLRSLMNAEGDHGYQAVGAAKVNLDKWRKFYALVVELQRNPETFLSGRYPKPKTDEEIEAEGGSEKKEFEKKGFTLDEAGKKIKILIDTETVRGQELSLTDVREPAKEGQFRLAHIAKLADEAYAHAVRKHVDPETAQQFEDRIRTIIGQAVRLRERESSMDIEEGGAAIERDLRELEDGIYTTASLQHSPPHRALLIRTREELRAKVVEAKDHLRRAIGAKRRELEANIKKNTTELCSAIESACLRQESDKSLKPEQQSRVIWSRVQQLIRGFDLQREQRRPGLPEAAYSERMDGLMADVVALQEQYQDQEAGNTVWRELRNSLQKAMNRIESDNGYGKLPGHYVLEIPECYQERLPKRIPRVELPLSGKDEIEPLKIEIMVNVESGAPRLMMSLLGNNEFQRELKIGRRYPRALPALGWESPQDDNLKPFYRGPQVARGSVALSLLIDRLPSLTGGEFLPNEIPLMVEECGNDQEQLARELEPTLEIFLKDLHRDLNISLDSQQTSELIHEFAGLLMRGELKYTGKQAEDESWTFETVLNPTGDIQGKLEAAVKFRTRYEKTLITLQKTIKRNEERVHRQMGLTQQQEPPRLPYDFRETALNAEQMRELIVAHRTCLSSPDKQGIVFLGDFGSGKTMLGTALANRKRQRLHMFNGNKYGELSSLDPGAATGNVADQLHLLGATLTQMMGVIAFLDEGQFLPAEVLNSLFDLLDVRGEYSVSLENDPKEDPEDINVFNTKNKTKKGNIFIMSGNLSYTIENPSTKQRMTVDFVFPEALSRRVVKLSTDDIEEKNEFLWTASYIERGSSDLGVHPDDVKYIISKQLTDEKFPKAVEIEANDPNLKTNFSNDPDRLREIERAISYRCLAAKTLIKIQKASRRTRQVGGDISKLGVPPCWMTAVGGGNVMTLMPLLTHQVKNEAEAMQIIYDHLLGNTEDRGPSHKEENILFLEQLTGSWKKYQPKDWKDASGLAQRMKEEGESADPVVGAIRGLTTQMSRFKEIVEFGKNERGEIEKSVFGALRQQSEVIKASLESLQKIAENSQGFDQDAKTAIAALPTMLQTKDFSAERMERFEKTILNIETRINSVSLTQNTIVSPTPEYDLTTLRAEFDARITNTRDQFTQIVTALIQSQATSAKGSELEEVKTKIDLLLNAVNQAGSKNTEVPKTPDAGDAPKLESELG